MYTPPLYTGGQWRLVATSPVPAGESHTVPDCQERKSGSRQVLCSNFSVLLSPLSSLALDYLVKLTAMELKKKIKKKVKLVNFSNHPDCSM